MHPLRPSGREKQFAVCTSYPLAPNASSPRPAIAPSKSPGRQARGSRGTSRFSAGGWAFVSDYANGLIHKLDPWGRWQTAFDGTGLAAGPAAAGSSPLERPTAIALDADGRIYVVQEGKDYVTVLGADGAFLGQIRRPDEVKGAFCPVAVATSPTGDLYIVDRCHATWVYCRRKDGAYACVGQCAAPGGGVGPLGASGAQSVCTSLAFDSAGRPLFCDAGQLQVTVLEPQASFPESGRLISEPLDSRIYRCTWHRVILHAALPAGTQMRVDTFTSEAEKSLPEVLDLPEERWSTGQLDSQVGDGTWDCLLQAPPGRYLWLRLTLMGDGSVTPEVRAIQIDYPRASSLRHLPAVYREDAASADFMDRFLSIFDRFWEGIAGQLDGLPAYFDPMATPAPHPQRAKLAPSASQERGAAAAGGLGDADFLSWLASWLGLSFDRNWPVAKRRLLLANVHRLYNLRGTPDGLRLHIRLFTGMEPQVLEHFKLRRWLTLNHVGWAARASCGARTSSTACIDSHATLDAVQLIDGGDPLHDPFSKYAHQFTVFVAGDEAQRPLLERIIDMARPAHSQGTLRLVQPRLRIGIQATIGVDTLIGDYPEGVVLSGQAGPGGSSNAPAPAGSKLGYDAISGQSPDEAGPPTLRIGETARIGSGTLID